MTRNHRRFQVSFLALTCCSIILLACHSGETKEKEAIYSIKKGGIKTNMRTYPMGRFSISVPIEFERTSQSHRFRGCNIEEFLWHQNSNREQAGKRVWDNHLSEIHKLRKPDGVDKLIIDSRKISNFKSFAEGVFYYGNYISARRGNWDILVDKGQTGVWLKYRGDLKAKEEMLNWVIDIVKAYRTYPPNNPSSLPSGNWYYTKYGAINLPFFEQEQTEASFYYRPLDLKLKIEMNDTHTEEAPDEGLIGRTTAVITTGYAAGVDIERIRSRKREIAGLKGEEEVDRMTSKDGTELDFGWRYAGEKNSGERPEILITMDSPDGNLDEKLKIWDAILDSLQPMYQMGE